MPPILTRSIAPLALLLAAGAASAQLTISTTLTPAKDNTLYEDPQGMTSNGRGVSLTVGITNAASRRRPLLAFDLSSIPPGAVISSASLTLTVTRASGGAIPSTYALHRVDADWGEGASLDASAGGTGVPAAPGDATWLNRFYSRTFWQIAGGDFQAAISGSATYSGNPALTFAPTPALIADVQAWVNAPASNFGWIVVGNEEGLGVALRLASREFATAEERPRLTVIYSAPPACPADFNGDTFIDPDDLADFIGAFFAIPPDPRADFNGDSVIDPDDLSDFIALFFSGGC